MAEMPNVISGNTITSTWGNQIRDRTIQRYANVSERTSENATPSVGDLAFMEDTGRVFVYFGGAWQVVGGQGDFKPGYAETTTAQTGITATTTNLTGMSVAVTVSAGRRIMVTGSGSVVQRTSAGTATGRIREGSTTLGRWGHGTLGINSQSLFYGSAILTPSAGAHTYLLSLETSAATVDTAPTTAGPLWILVEDIGTV